MNTSITVTTPRAANQGNGQPLGTESVSIQITQAPRSQSIVELIQSLTQGIREKHPDNQPAGLLYQASQTSNALKALGRSNTLSDEQITNGFSRLARSFDEHNINTHTELNLEITKIFTEPDKRLGIILNTSIRTALDESREFGCAPGSCQSCASTSCGNQREPLLGSTGSASTPAPCCNIM